MGRVLTRWAPPPPRARRHRHRRPAIESKAAFTERAMHASTTGHAAGALNQPPEFAPRDLWESDVALREAVAREGAGGFSDRLATYGRLAGDELYRLGFDANRDRPRLRTHDRFGQRIDRVEFHPDYHALMGQAIEGGVTSLSWSDARAGAHVARAALSYLHHQ